MNKLSVPDKSPRGMDTEKRLLDKDITDSRLQIAQSCENFRIPAESLLGVPPPYDDELSFTSMNSSFSVAGADVQDQLDVIRTKNEELRKTATMTIQDFKNTSRNLLSRSQLHSIVLSEMDNNKKNLENTDEEVKNQNSINLASLDGDDNMGAVYQKIQDIQREINEAAQRLLESEKMIMCTETKNQILESRIKELEKSLINIDITEGPEKQRNEICHCVVI